MRNVAELLEIARKAVRLGAELVKATTPQEIHEKGDRDLVTEVDIKVEHKLRDYLGKMTPEIGFLGEEEGQKREQFEFVWTLDPIDGTSNFAHGVPLCAVSLALVCNRQPTVAAVTAPFLDLHYHAAKNDGAFCNDKRIAVSKAADLTRAIVSIGDYAVGADAAEKNRRRIRLTTLLAARVERIRMFGSAALDLAWVAEGRTDATVILANKPWDTAAGVLLAREAGALVLDASGGRHTLTSTETIAVCPTLAEPLLSLVQESL